MFAISVLVVTCPCALGLATPAAIYVGMGVGARNGLLFRGGEPLQRARDVTHFVLDKTGTLTKGALTVSSVRRYEYLYAEDYHRDMYCCVVG